MGKRVFLANATMSRVVLGLCLIVMLMVGMVTIAHAEISIRYAKPDGNVTGDCLSWSTACSLQRAIEVATYGEEIWVAKGVHYPGTSSDSSFAMKSGVAVYGGFLGTETQLTERDWIANPTVLSGDVDHNDTNKDANGIVTDVVGVHGNNAHNVLVSTADVSNATVDGFIINAGQSSPTGGGVNITYSSPTLKNLIIIANSASTAGAGLMVSVGSPELTNVVFRGNYLTSQSSGMGGGMFTDQGNPTLTNVLFSGNRAIYGGGFASYSGLPTLINVTFSGNSAEYGGAVYVWNDTTSLTNAIIWGNSSAIWGAGATITNSIVQGGFSGTGNLDVDPQFVNPVAYTSAPTTFGDYHFQVSSPAIDAGNNSPVIVLTDLDGNPRIVDGDGNGVSTVDLGAYEGPTSLLFLPLIVR